MTARTYSSTPGSERVQAVGCPLCGSTRSFPRLRAEGVCFAGCRSCGMVFQNPRPVFEDLRRRYAGEYFSYELQNEAAFLALIQKGLDDIDFEGVTAGLRGPRRLLDVGCATGLFLACMRDRGWQVAGADVCSESAKHGREKRGLDIRAGTLQEASFPAGFFSVVHFSHLIEHLPEPRPFVAEVRRILSPGGFAVVTTPNIDGFQARLFGSGWRSVIPDHIALFSRRTLSRLLADEGFTVHRSVTWGGLAKGTAPAWLKRIADRLAKKWGFGDVVLVLAQR